MIVLVVHSIKAVIAARQNSNDASSFMLGFKQVLRGVCDGELLLHQDSCTIVDDACCLERLLKSPKKLSQSNFLDLFLDEQSRDAQLKGGNGWSAVLKSCLLLSQRISVQKCKERVYICLYNEVCIQT